MTSETKELGLSLWLIPPEDYKPSSQLSTLTTSSFPASANFPNSPSFTPHITLTSSVPVPSDPLLPLLNLDSLPLPDVQFSELAHGDTYFKKIFLRIKKTDTLVGLAKHVRDTLLPAAPPFNAEIYDPHISLIYSDEEPTEKRVEYVAWKTSMAIGNSQGWKGGKVALVDTRSRNVNDWKVIEEYAFPS
jgi:2',3'-cyclic-nucleotide 3'-phosphodiesterase